MLRVSRQPGTPLPTPLPAPFQPRDGSLRPALHPQSPHCSPRGLGGGVPSPEPGAPDRTVNPQRLPAPHPAPVLVSPHRHPPSCPPLSHSPSTFRTRGGRDKPCFFQRPPLTTGADPSGRGRPRFGASRGGAGVQLRMLQSRRAPVTLQIGYRRFENSPCRRSSRQSGKGSDRCCRKCPHSQPLLTCHLTCNTDGDKKRLSNCPCRNHYSCHNCC